MRWRGPDPSWLEALRVTELADLADVPIIGIVVVAIVAPVVVAVVVAFVPFVALGILEALLLAVLATLLLAAASLFGRPIIVRAERDDDLGRGAMVVWAVKGWAASRQVRDAVVDALRSGTDPADAAGPAATLIADHRSLRAPPTPREA